MSSTLAKLESSRLLLALVFLVLVLPVCCLTGLGGTSVTAKAVEGSESEATSAPVVSPHISISPTTGALGVTNFTESYSGFTHNETITETAIYPNGGPTVFHVNADANGNASVSFVLGSQSGNYSSSGVDDATG